VSGEPTACPSSRIPWEHYTEEDDDMKPFLCWDVDRQRAYLVGPFGATWITNADDVKTLEGLYGKMAVAMHATSLDALAAA
jgi:hypothetical protein